MGNAATDRALAATGTLGPPSGQWTIDYLDGEGQAHVDLGELLAASAQSRGFGRHGVECRWSDMAKLFYVRAGEAISFGTFTLRRLS